MNNKKNIGTMNKVTKVTSDYIEFDDEVQLFSDHDSQCCERHYLDFSNITLADFEGLEFDLSRDDFFERIEYFGIALKPVDGFPVRIPGYGSNNGYYSSNLDLILKGTNFEKRFDITECQDY
jgi:hypothetical protein